MYSPLGQLTTVILLLIVIIIVVVLKVPSVSSDSKSAKVTDASAGKEPNNNNKDANDHDQAPSCVTSNDCLEPVGSFCFGGRCRCKIFYTNQSSSKKENSSSSKSTIGSTSGTYTRTENLLESVCVPIRCGSTEDCGVGQGADDYRQELLTCVSSVCQCKTPLVLVDSDTRCGNPVWVNIFKWGGFISLTAILIGLLACFCRWSGLLQFCTGGRGSGNGGPNGGDLLSSSMVTIKSAAIIGRKPTPSPPGNFDYHLQQQKKEKGEH